MYFGIIIEFLPIFHFYDILIHFQILNQTCTVGINPIRSLCIIMLLNPSSYYLPHDRPINQEFKNSDFFYTKRSGGGLVVTHFLVLARPWKRKTSAKFRLRKTPQNVRPIFLKTFKIMKNMEGMRNCHRAEKTEETWRRLNTMRYTGLGPVYWEQEKVTNGNTSEI